MVAPTVPSLSARGVSRWTPALLATGGLALLVGAVFLFPFLISQGAHQNDVFLTNLFVGALYCVLGGALYAISLAGFGLPSGIALALVLINPLALAALVWLAGLVVWMA